LIEIFFSSLNLAIQENPKIEDFSEFIEMNPHLDNIRIIFEYYSKEHLYNEEAQIRLCYLYEFLVFLLALTNLLLLQFQTTRSKARTVRYPFISQ